MPYSMTPRPASRQSQCSPALSQAPKSPSSHNSSQAKPKTRTTQTRLLLNNGSTTSLVPKPSSPEHVQQHKRRRVQSLSYQSPVPMSKPNHSLPQLSTAQDTQERPPRTPLRILFYHRHLPYYEFTNFSEHPVKYKGKRYPTSEHLFQSFKVSTFLHVMKDFGVHDLLVSRPPSGPCGTHSVVLPETKRCSFRSPPLSTRSASGLDASECQKG